MKRVKDDWVINILSDDFTHVRYCAYIVNFIVYVRLKNIGDLIV